MFLFVLLVVVTFMVVAGYFIQFSAQHAEGTLKTFGKYLSLWVFVLAGLLIVAAAVRPAIANRGFGPGPRGVFFNRAVGPGFGPGPGFTRGFRRNRPGNPQQNAGPNAPQGQGQQTPAPGSAPAPAP
jgi:hypothetical protein